MYECISALISSRYILFLGIEIICSLFLKQWCTLYDHETHHTIFTRLWVKLHQLSRPAINIKMGSKWRQRQLLPLKIHILYWPFHQRWVLHPPTSGQTRDLSKDPVCGLQLCFQHHHPGHPHHSFICT